MDTKRLPISYAEDTGHIPTQPFGTIGVSSVPHAASERRPSAKEFLPFRFVLAKPDIEQELSANMPPAVPIEQLFDVERLNAQLSSRVRKAPPDSPNPSRSARFGKPKLPLAGWGLGALALIVCTLTLIIWLQGASSAEEVAQPSAPANSSSTAAQASDSEQLALGDDLQETEPTKADSERTSLRSATATQRIAAIRSPAATKRRSVLDSVLAPPPD